MNQVEPSASENLRYAETVNQDLIFLFTADFDC